MAEALRCEQQGPLTTPSCIQGSGRTDLDSRSSFRKPCPAPQLLGEVNSARTFGVFAKASKHHGIHCVDYSGAKQLELEEPLLCGLDALSTSKLSLPRHFREVRCQCQASETESCSRSHWTCTRSGLRCQSLPMPTD